MFALYNILFLIIGYLIGSISTAIIITKIKMKTDIRHVGSTNAGATNVTMTLGKKWGAFVLFLDVLKTVVAFMICYSLLQYIFPLINGFEDKYVFTQISSIGVILGHIYPLYFKFKGGKGASIILGYFVIAMWLLVPIALVFWFSIALKKRSAVLASLLVVTSAVVIYYGLEIILDVLDAKQMWLTPLLYEYSWWTNIIFITIMWTTALLKQLKFI